jgi:uncharacterized RDD family membrane protein YckC
MSQRSGWYDDPQDASRLRYWDGVLWTDHTVPKQSPTAADSTIGRPVDPYAARQPADAAAAGAGPTGYPGGGGPAAYPGQTPYANPGQTPYSAPPGSFGYGAAPTLPWRPSGPTTPEGTPLAEWWQRLVAAIVDGIIVQLLTLLLAFPWIRDFLTWYADLIRSAASTPTSAQPDPTTLFDDILTQMESFLVPVTVITVLVTLVYHVAFLATRGATPGKMLLGIRVRSIAQPGPPSVLVAVRRAALPVLFQLMGIVPLIGMFASFATMLDDAWLLWDRRRQCWHDKVAETLVEQRPKRLR